MQPPPQHAPGLKQSQWPPSGVQVTVAAQIPLWQVPVAPPPVMQVPPSLVGFVLHTPPSHVEVLQASLGQTFPHAWQWSGSESRSIQNPSQSAQSPVQSVFGIPTQLPVEQTKSAQASLAAHDVPSASGTSWHPCPASEQMAVVQALSVSAQMTGA